MIRSVTVSELSPAAIRTISEITASLSGSMYQDDGGPSGPSDSNGFGEPEPRTSLKSGYFAKLESPRNEVIQLTTHQSGFNTIT